MLVLWKETNLGPIKFFFKQKPWEGYKSYSQLVEPIYLIKQSGNYLHMYEIIDISELYNKPVNSHTYIMHTVHS